MMEISIAPQHDLIQWDRSVCLSTSRFFILEQYVRALHTSHDSAFWCGIACVTGTIAKAVAACGLVLPFCLCCRAETQVV